MVPINVDIELAVSIHTISTTFKSVPRYLVREAKLTTRRSKQKALYLSSSKSGDTVTFTFLARAATRNVADSISFCRFDASMGQHWAQAKVAVTIQDV